MTVAFPQQLYLTVGLQCTYSQKFHFDSSKSSFLDSLQPALSVAINFYTFLGLGKSVGKNMADNDAPQELNLEQILQTLANLPQAQNVMQPDHHQSLDSQPAAVLNGATLGSFSSIPKSQLPNQERSLDPRLNDRNPPQHHPASSRPQPPPRTATPAIDPATITDWKHGLRCVSKIAAQNPGFEASIRKLIQRQEQSVREWNTGRTRLIEEQRVKRENEQTQRAAISLPGILANMPVLRVRTYCFTS